MDSTSVSLLERLRQPNAHDAWARFVKLYGPLLYFWARRVGLQSQDAADLVQDVLTVLVQKMPGFCYDDQKSFRNWLRTVLRNKWRENHRRQGPCNTCTEGLADCPEAENVVLFEDAEYREHLARQALQLMQADFQPTTWKACWEQVVSSRTAADVAAELGISEGAAYVAKCRVLRRLRQELAGLMD